MKELSKQLAGSTAVSPVTLFSGIKQPKVYFGIPANDARAPFSGLSVKINPFKSALIIFCQTAIGGVLMAISLSKVDPSVVAALMIFVVYSVLRPLAGNIKPREHVLVQTISINGDTAISSGAVEHARDFASVSCVDHFRNVETGLPTKDPGSLVVRYRSPYSAERQRLVSSAAVWKVNSSHTNLLNSLWSGAERALCRCLPVPASYSVGV